MGKETVSFWQGGRALKSYPSLKENLQVDVCVIGAGIAGLSTAYTLSKSDKQVVVLDDGPVAGGQTVRTTGHLVDILDARYFTLERYFGIEGAKLAAKSHRSAIEFIADLVKKHQIPCHFEYLDAYLFVPPGESLDVLKKELGAVHRVGLKGVELVERAPIHSFDTGKCLRFSHQAQFFPLPYIDKLCDLIHEQGSQIFTKTHASHIQKKGELYLVKTEEGYTVQAKHVIIATNSPIASRFLPHLKQAPYRTYVIGGKIARGNIARALYYDTSDPYHYIRVIPLDEKYDTLILGGEDHRTAEVRDIQAVYDKLEAWTRERFPDFEEITYRWSGQVIEPIDGLAFIGKLKKDAEIYMITGDAGNGLTHGTIAGILLNDLIHKKKNPWEELYDPHRKTLKAFPDFAKENGNTVCQYRDWITEGDLESVAELPKNTGAILRKGLSKCAVYRDLKGDLHRMSPVCPHLGALVRWNGSEHCWECPAHGSRFSAGGQVIQGPANCDLRKENH
ncbi:MAG: FAD-dependent oxidoreductase [Chlamydiota bacterium]